MTAEPVAAALRECESACPCHSGQHQEWCHGDLGWEGLSICLCNQSLRHDDPPLNQPCLWPGHAAIARYGDLREKAGREAERILDRCPGCGSQTIFVGSHGALTCSLLKCRSVTLQMWLDAARLAGKIEQAELSAQFLYHPTAEEALHAEVARLHKERDRLRRGEGK